MPRRLTLCLHGSKLRLPNISQVQRPIVLICHLGKHLIPHREQQFECRAVVACHRHTLRSTDGCTLNSRRIAACLRERKTLLCIEERRIVVEALVGSIELLRKAVFLLALRHMIECRSSGNALFTGIDILLPIDHGSIEPKQNRKQ